ncbi:serine/threonine-protein kinase D6PKL1-like [Herrania umbratica]|uniref:non-specific serine/threonine protein kinase n=1 Tax=Herrania umbratica TaxID=108875 RepID=A0A6J1B884_9ROSI|nr:serine/threonine-protein kinase D6PKL1-like [Herrania umbratica]
MVPKDELQLWKYKWELTKWFLAGPMVQLQTLPHGPTSFCRPMLSFLTLQKPLPISRSFPILISHIRSHFHQQGWLHPSITMQQCVDDLADDLDNLSFTSTTTTSTTATTSTTVPETKRSTSSGSEATWTPSSLLSTSTKHHHAPPRDPCWHAIQLVKSENNVLTLADLRFVHRLGSGDIGSVYLVELKGASGCFFAAKVMDKKELMSRNKASRARIEREILESLDHPFLPTLYATLDSPRWSCLLTEFCPGGDLHVLRQRQPHRRFHETAVRFYASEVVVALEYLHMMGIIYRDLKPENVLVRSDGHIMLTDFDLSLKSDNPTSTAQLVSDQNTSTTNSSSDPTADPPPFANSSCILPNCIAPAVSCLHPKSRKRRKKSMHRGDLEIVAEPVDVRSMSFVGTHEYLAPEIVSGEGHGNAVDWWTLGIFMFEMFYGVTPFKGIDHELTLANIVARALEFPKEPSVPAPAKDLIAQLLVKDPSRRMGSTMGSTAIKHHHFFNGVNWALLRCTTPPYTPRPVTHKEFLAVDNSTHNSVEYY